MSEALDRLWILAKEIPAKERRISEAKSDIERAKAIQKSQEAIVLTTEQIDGKNAETRAAQLAVKMALDKNYTGAEKIIKDAEAEIIAGTERLSIDTHLWRVLDLTAQMEIADRLVMAGASRPAP